MFAALVALTLAASPPAEQPAGTYAQLSSGLKLYFEKHGEKGPPILLLHAGTGSVKDWAKVLPAMSASHVVYLPEFQGHGHTADIERAMSYDGFTEDIAEFLAQQKLEHVDVAGLSDGGIVALLLAIKHPLLVRKVLVSGAHWQSSNSMEPATLKWLTQAKPEDWDKAFIAQWSDGNPDPAHWPIFFAKMKKMWVGLNRPMKELEAIRAPVMLMAGDSDLVKLDHTVEMHRHLKDSELAILPGTGHDTPAMRPEWFAAIALDFFATEVPPTPAPRPEGSAPPPKPKPVPAAPPK